MSQRRWARDVRRAMKGRPNFRVFFSASQTAASLWDYGEDELADLALAMTAEDLTAIQRIAATYEDPSYALPIDGQRITHNHVNAIAAVAYFEGRPRPLSRIRRRPEKSRPTRFTPLLDEPAINSARE